MKAINLGVTFLLELCMLAALAYWGWQTANSPLNIILAVGAPFFAILIWAQFMAPKSENQLTGWRYILLKAILFGLAAVLLASAGQPLLAVIFAGTAIVSEILATVWKQIPT